MLLLTGVVVVVYAFVTDRSQLRLHLLGRYRIGLLGGACLYASYAIALWAMTYAPIGLVAALRETSVVLAILLAVLFLRERVSRVRWAAVGVIAAGTVAIKLS